MRVELWCNHETYEWPLSEQDLDRLMRTFAGWARGVAIGMRGHRVDDSTDDYIQIIMLAMLKAAKGWDASKGSLDGWMKQCGRWAMLDALKKDHRSWVEFPIDSTWDIEETARTQADVFDGLAWNCHRHEVTEAVRSLTPLQREYVVRRFWLGHRKPDLQDLGKNPLSSLWFKRKYGARDQLQKKLGHLKELAGS